MKKKYYFVILFLALAIFLSGCAGGGIVTPATDEAKVKSVIQEYFLARNDKDWSKAKSYCVYESDQYYTTCGFEDAVNALEQYYGIVTTTSFVYIYNVSIAGNYADAYLEITIFITAGVYNDSGVTTGYYYLQKVGNTWKIYSSSQV